MVAAATNNLCEAANSAVQGHASEEKLISSAKQVAASTAQLLVACKVKADQDSQTMKRLQVSCGRAKVNELRGQIENPGHKKNALSQSLVSYYTYCSLLLFICLSHPSTRSQMH